MTYQKDGEAGLSSALKDIDDISVFLESDGSCRVIPMVDDRLDSRDLFAAGRLITIAHGEQTYQLRLTAQNKLILTK